MTLSIVFGSYLSLEYLKSQEGSAKKKKLQAYVYLHVDGACKNMLFFL